MIAMMKVEMIIGVRWGGGNALLRTAHIFLLPGRVERGGGPGPGFLRSSVRPDFCDFLEFLSINVMEFQ